MVAQVAFVDEQRIKKMCDSKNAPIPCLNAHPFKNNADGVSSQRVDGGEERRQLDMRNIKPISRERIQALRESAQNPTRSNPNFSPTR